MVSQMDIKHEQALVAKECKAAKLRKMDEITQACLEQYEEDQEALRRLEAQEHKVHAQKLQRAAEKREAVEEEMALQHLEVQKVQLLETLAKREKAIEAEWAK